MSIYIFTKFQFLFKVKNSIGNCDDGLFSNIIFEQPLYFYRNRILNKSITEIEIKNFLFILKMQTILKIDYPITSILSMSLQFLKVSL